MTEKDIKKLLLHGERLTLECKEGQSAVPKSIWESYSAFANTIGGAILLGCVPSNGATRVDKQGINLQEMPSSPGRMKF